MLMHIKMSTSNTREKIIVFIGLYVDDCVMMSNDITLLEKKKLHLKLEFHMLVLFNIVLEYKLQRIKLKELIDYSFTRKICK
jgi:hypothetical protein